MPTDHVLSVPAKAYSYVRCSTPEQMQGDTFRRQFELAEAYASKRGWEVDRTLKLHDAGVSAYTHVSDEQVAVSFASVAD